MAHGGGFGSLEEQNWESTHCRPVCLEATKDSDTHDTIIEYDDAEESPKDPTKTENVSNVKQDHTCPLVPVCSEDHLENRGRASPACEGQLESTSSCTSLQYDFDRDKVASPRKGLKQHPELQTIRKRRGAEDSNNENVGIVLQSSALGSMQESNSIADAAENICRSENATEETEFRHRHAGIAKANVEKAEGPRGSHAPVESTGREDQRSRVTPEPAFVHGHKDKPLKLSLFRYFMTEISRGYLMELEEDRYTDKRRKVYKIMKIPKEFEKLMVFGFMLCLDCFLFIFTYLPLRVAVALPKLLCRLFCSRTRGLEPAQICDLIKGTLIVLCSFLLTYVDFSVMYHTVRGQSVIKLYVIYNMLEIADRLFSSFGQDILDSLFWTATEPKDRGREHIGILPHFVLAVIYMFLHAVLVLFQATCLNVAVNSHNKALLVIMVSNQFIELKGSVFKRFERNNLFQMACSDIRERFHYIVLVTICALRNLTEFNWNLEHLYVILPYLMAVLVSEYFVDWIKHAFITKFNDIPAEVYTEYRALLAQDATSSRQKNAQSDHFDLVSRRLGFIPLPLGSVVIRVVTQSIRLHGVAGICLFVVTYFFLTSAKVLNSIILLGKAFKYVNEKQQKTPDETSDSSAAALQPQVPMNSANLNVPSKGFHNTGVKHSTDKPPGDGKRRAKTLAEIDRYTLCSKEIVVF